MSKVKTSAQNSKLNEFWRDWKSTILLGAGILSLALVLRLYNLTILPVFGDEAIYLRWSQVMGAEPGLRFLPLSDGKQPLFMWVLMFLVRRFSDPLFIGRLTSVFYGMGTLLGIFTLTYYLFKSKKVALIASLFWAISPYSVFFDRMALVDSMLTMFGVWTFYFASITAKTLRFDMAILAGFTLGGALLTKSPAQFFVILIPTTWLVSRWPVKRLKKFFQKRNLVHLIRLSLLFLVTLVIGYGLYNILRLGENFHLIASRNQDYIYPLSHVFERPLDPLIPFLDRSVEWLWALGPSVFVLLVFAVIILNFKSHRKEILLLSAWAFIPLVISAEYAKVFTARYLLFIFPPLVILTASVLLVKKYKYVFNVVLIIFVLHSLWIDYLLLSNVEAAPLPRGERSGYLEEWTSGTGIKEISAIIRNEYQRNPQEKIVVGTEGFFGTLPDALQAYLNDLPEITVIGVGQPIRDVSIQLIESKQAGNKTYLVVNSTRFIGNAEELGLELSAVYPKAFRPDGSRESLYLFVVTQSALNLKKSP